MNVVLPKVKILCLNLFEGGMFWDNIQSFITRENPDILCLQEVSNGDEKQPANFQTIRRLTSLLPNHYFYYSPEFCEVWTQGEGDGGNAIFSRFPLQDTRTVFLHGAYHRFARSDKKDFTEYPKNLQEATVTIEGKKLHLFNMHGIWGSDGNDNPERLEMSKKIGEIVRGKSPSVLMGDFNLQPATQTIANIEKYMNNVFKGELTTSFNMRHKTNPGYATAVVDMFFATTDISIISKSCPDDDVSDHKPLIVTLSF